MAQSLKIDTLDQPAGEIWPLSLVAGSVVQGDCYQSKDPDNQTEVQLWLSREPLSAERKKAFKEHIDRLLKIRPVSGIDFGIDAEGRAFVAMPAASSKRINFDQPSIVSLRNRYLRCLFMIAEFHKRECSCGNLSSASFTSNAAGNVDFIGYLGGFESSLDLGNASEIRRYVRANDKHPGRCSPAADVYALAVIGLELFGAKLGFGALDPNEIDNYLEDVSEDAPPWVFSVLATIARDPSHTLCRDTKELIKSLEVGEGNYLKELRLTRRGLKSGSADEQALSFNQVREEFISRSELIKRRFEQIVESKFVKLGLTIVAAGMMFPVISAHLLDPKQRADESTRGADTVINDLSLQKEDNSKILLNLIGQVRQAKHELARGSMGAAGMLMNSAQSALVLAEKSKELITYLLNTDPATPEGNEIFQFYASAEEDSKVVLSGAFLEAGGGWEKVYKERLISNIQRAGSADAEFLSGLSTDTLFLASETRLSSRAAETWGRKDKISNEQLWWLLQLHTKKKTPLIPYLATATYERNLVAWPRVVYLDAMMRADPGSSPPYESLYRAVKDELSPSDVNAIAAWNEPQAIKVLYSVSLSAKDPNVVNRAVTGLVLQPVFESAPRPVLEYLRNNSEAELWRYAKIIGGLGLNTSEADPFLAEGLRDLRNEPSFGTIVSALIDNGSARAVGVLLRVYGRVVHPDRLIKLLGHPDPSVRREVLPFLREVRITSSKEKIRDMYDIEKDPEIRKLYEKELFQGKSSISGWLSAG